MDNMYEFGPVVTESSKHGTKTYYFTDAEYAAYQKKQVQGRTIFFDKLITRIIGIVVAICFTVWLVYRALR
jgi:hypothetical protein